MSWGRLSISAISQLLLQLVSSSVALPAELVSPVVGVVAVDVEGWGKGGIILCPAGAGQYVHGN